MNLTRRDLGKLALAAIPAASLLAKPNSDWNGVQVGMNVPYSYGNNNMTADETIANLSIVPCYYGAEFFNDSGPNIEVVADLSGYFPDSAG